MARAVAESRGGIVERRRYWSCSLCLFIQPLGVQLMPVGFDQDHVAELLEGGVRHQAISSDMSVSVIWSPWNFVSVWKFQFLE